MFTDKNVSKLKAEAVKAEFDAEGALGGSHG